MTNLSPKLPASRMVRVPTVLIPAVGELSRLHRAGQTTRLLQGLQALLADLDSSVAVPAPDEKVLLQLLVASIERVYQKLETIDERLARLEAGQGRPSSKGKYTPSVPQQAEFQTFEEENLARRLGVDIKTLIQHRTNDSAEEFVRWSRRKDPGQLGWRYQESDKMYHPVRQ
jgi:hypothetical protein